MASLFRPLLYFDHFWLHDRFTKLLMSATKEHSWIGSLFGSTRSLSNYSGAISHVKISVIWNIIFILLYSSQNQGMGQRRAAKNPISSRRSAIYIRVVSLYSVPAGTYFVVVNLIFIYIFLMFVFFSMFMLFCESCLAA